jgi:hypothetical protein
MTTNTAMPLREEAKKLFIDILVQLNGLICVLTNSLLMLQEAVASKKFW